MLPLHRHEAGAGHPHPASPIFRHPINPHGGNPAAGAIHTNEVVRLQAKEPPLRACPNVALAILVDGSYELVAEAVRRTVALKFPGEIA